MTERKYGQCKCGATLTMLHMTECPLRERMKQSPLKPMFYVRVVQVDEQPTWHRDWLTGGGVRNGP